MRVSLALFVVLFCCGVTHAEVVDSEDFESFSNLPFEIVDDDDWDVIEGQEANVTVVSSSLAYNRGSIVVNGGSQALQVGPDLPSATTNNLADWIFSDTEADNVWFSYLFQTSETASTSLPDEDDARNFFQMFISADGSDNGQSLSMVIDNNRGGPPGGDHNYRARAGSSGQNTTGFTDGTGEVLTAPDETHFIVGHLEKVGDDYETVSIFANPGTETVPDTPTATATWEPVDITSLSQLTFRISGLQDDDVYLIDELIIGESYADVVPSDPNFTIGDFNSDGKLDDLDAGILADNLFEGTTHAQGDFNFSGFVDLRDFVELRDALSGQPGAPVPEPSGILLLLVASAVITRFRRRRLGVRDAW